MKEKIIEAYKQLQDNICKGLAEADGGAEFVEDLWERPEGGGGRTRIISHGNVFEKGGVAFSAVHGKIPDFLLKENSKLPADGTFLATGVSLVMHPKNPFVPIIHMNVRYFEIDGFTFWFGGGIDLTPHYVNLEDANYFHSCLANTCHKFDAAYYPKFKQWADDYFYLPHRKETRGIGGIFFDHLGRNGETDKSTLFEFSLAIGNTFLPSYLPLVEKNKNLAFTEENKKWQEIRRGRYVEFNLVYDRGTKFGLETGGRTESILMSLPPVAQWQYNYQPQPGSIEEQTQQQLIKGINRLEYSKH
jgi:coproporphyrinogen III oxidase